MRECTHKGYCKRADTAWCAVGYCPFRKTLGRRDKTMTKDEKDERRYERELEYYNLISRLKEAEQASEKLTHRLERLYYQALKLGSGAKYCNDRR